MSDSNVAESIHAKAILTLLRLEKECGPQFTATLNNQFIGKILHEISMLGRLNLGQ